MGTKGTRPPKDKAPVQPPAFTERSIQRILNARYMPEGRYVLNNLFIFGWESDYAACSKSGYWHEVEIKVTFADFRNDFRNKADKYAALISSQSLRPNYFSYAVPDGLADRVKDLVPRWAGLVSVSSEGRLTRVKMPEMLHRNKYSDELLKLKEKFYYGFINYRDKYMELRNELDGLRKELA